MSRGASPIRVRRERGRAFRSDADPGFHQRKLWRLLACMALAVVLGLTYVWQYIQTNVLGYRLLEVQLANDTLRTQITRLENQAAQLAAPARIDTVSRRDLHMVRQGTWDLVLLPEPEPMAYAPLPEAPMFWSIQAARWRRVGDRLHTTLGPGRALAASGPADGDGDD